MFDKLDDLVEKLNEILKELESPEIVNDQERYRKLMKEQSDITPVVDKYNNISRLSRMWLILLKSLTRRQMKR